MTAKDMFIHKVLINELGENGPRGRPRLTEHKL